MGANAFQLEFGNESKDIRILDVGAGTGLAAEEVSEFGNEIKTLGFWMSWNFIGC